MCSIFKISNHGLSGAGIKVEQPFYAMVMDRGGAIQGNHFDLYIGLQSANPLQRIYVSTANAELIRYGGIMSKVVYFKGISFLSNQDLHLFFPFVRQFIFTDIKHKG